jgi:crossover junction endonuclease MUS81
MLNNIFNKLNKLKNISEFKITIDKREHKIINHLDNMGLKDYDFIKYENVDIGDFNFSNNNVDYCVIERKTISDLLSSITDSRYKEQKTRLKCSSSKVYYLIEGQIKKSNKKASIAYGSIINTMMRDNIEIVRSMSIDETIYMVFHMFYKSIMFFNHEETSQVIDYSHNVKLRKKDNYNRRNIFIFQLTCIPGVSSHMAEKVVDTYNTMYELIKFYEYCETDKQRECLLMDLEYRTPTNNFRKIGKCISKKIFENLI